MVMRIEAGCIGCGVCESVCPEVFRITSEGTAEVYAQPDASVESSAREAADRCPVQVIIAE